MFIYLVIAIELLILVGGLYFAFIHEPRPRKIKSSTWGTYQDAHNDDDAYLLLSNRFPKGILVENNRGEAAEKSVIPLKTQPEKKSA